MDGTKIFGKEFLSDWMDRNHYTQENMSAMVIHGIWITAILTKDNKVYHSNGFVEPHFTKISAMNRMENLAEDEDKKTVERNELLYRLAFIVEKNIALFKDSELQDISNLLSELKDIDPDQYKNLIGGDLKWNVMD